MLALAMNFLSFRMTVNRRLILSLSLCASVLYCTATASDLDSVIGLPVALAVSHSGTGTTRNF